MVVENTSPFDINTYDRENGTLYRLFDVLRNTHKEVLLSDAITLGFFPLAQKDGPKHYVRGRDICTTLSGIESGAIKIPDRKKGGVPDTKKLLKCSSDCESFYYGYVERTRTPDETSALIALYQENQDISIRQIVYESNIPLVIVTANRMNHPRSGIDLEDLVCEGSQGLSIAIEKFDPYRGFAFSTYAVYWIKNKMRNCLPSRRQIHLPTYMIKVCHDMVKAHGDKWFEDPEILMRVKKQFAQLTPIEIKQAGRAYNQPFAAEESCDTNTFEPKGKHEDPADTIIDDMSKPEILASALEVLSSRNRFIIEQYFGLGGTDVKTLKAIGQTVDLSRERVRQIIEESIALMKSKFE